MTYKIRYARKDKPCAECKLEIVTEEYYVNMLMAKGSKFYYLNFHHNCFKDRLDRQLEEKKAKDLAPRKVAIMKERLTADESKQVVVNDWVKQRRRTVLQYLNYARWDLIECYTEGNNPRLARKYNLIAKYIDELVDLGIKFKLNALGELIKLCDIKMYGELATYPSWSARAKAFRTRADQLADSPLSPQVVDMAPRRGRESLVRS